MVDYDKHYCCSEYVILQYICWLLKYLNKVVTDYVLFCR